LNGDLELDEFLRDPAAPTRSDRSPRRILLTIPRFPASTSHYAGQLQFGPRDGYLYMSTGDGGGRVKPIGEPARDLTSLLGKMLRIKPLPHGTSPYSIPGNNPYVGKHGRDEIYAYGLRQPYRFSFDDRDIIIADVGEKRREEVNYMRTGAVAGVNFGWPEYEGDLIFNPNRPGPDPATPPIFVVAHDKNHGGPCAIMGGYVVHDPNLPTLLGRYVYGDLCTGDIRSFRANVRDQLTFGDRSTGVVLGYGVDSFGLGAGGQIYISLITGNVYRLAPPPP